MTVIQIKKALQILLLAACVALSHTSWLDIMAENYTEQGLKRSLVTYAVSRSLNGVISVAQGTEVAVSPAGIGMTFAPGQILDPVNDLIERFSWIVLASGTSLGIQRLFLEMSSAAIISWLLTGLVISILVFNLLISQQDEKYILWQRILYKSLIITLLLRFTVPLIAVINEGLYLSYLQPRYEQAQKHLEQASDNIELVNQASQGEYVKQPDKPDAEKSLLEKAELWLNKTQKSLDVETQMQSLKQAASDISQQIINMIVVFVVQTILFPLIFLWVFIRSAKVLMRQFTL